MWGLEEGYGPKGIRLKRLCDTVYIVTPLQSVWQPYVSVTEVMGLTPAIGGHVFTECAPRCRSCKDKQYSSDCNDRFCVAGYVCPDNHHTDFHGSCVLGDECTCLDEEKEETKVLHAGASHYYICTTW